MDRRNQDASITAVLNSRLLSYVIAAGATLAASVPSKAEVLFTPNNSFLKPPSSLVIDLNHDGVADVLLKVKEVLATSSGFPYKVVGRATVYPLGAGIQFERYSSFPRLRPLKRGQLIDSQDQFLSLGVLASGVSGGGEFNNVQNRFLGVKLLVNGEVHFGWIGFRSVDARKTVHVTLAGWAYETNPDTPITAGDMGTNNTSAISPTSLEVLASGHAAIDQCRKRTVTAGGL